MTVIDWLEFVTSYPDFETSQRFSEQVFEIVYLNFFQSNYLQANMEGYVSSLSSFLSKYIGERQNGNISDIAVVREAIVQLLRRKACIATTRGMMKPEAAYLKSVDFFNDLPHVVMFEESDKEGSNRTDSDIPEKKEKKPKGILGGFLSWSGVRSSGSSKAQHFQIPNSFWLKLGVRDRVDLQLIFQRLKGLDWNIKDLVKYLSSIELSSEEITKLSNTPFLNSERQIDSAKEVLNLREDTNTEIDPQDFMASLQKSLAKELYFPNDTLRDLGFPIVYWPPDSEMQSHHYNRLKPDSKEGKLLMRIGLKVHPTIGELLAKNIIFDVESNFENNTNYDEYRASMVFNYFMTHFDSVYQQPYRSLRSRLQTPFVPCFKPKVLVEELKFAHGEGYRPATCRKELRLPQECFSNIRSAAMDFWVVQEQYVCHCEDLGIQREPSPKLLLNILQMAPPSLSKVALLNSSDEVLSSSSVACIAKESGSSGGRGDLDACVVFAYMSRRAHELSSSDWYAVSQLKMIPAYDNSKGDVVLYTADEIYFGGPSGETENNEDEMRELFTYVNLNDSSANSFLKACGVKSEPTPEELAKELVHDPTKFYEAMGYKRYLSALRQIAVTFDTVIGHVSIQEMRKSPFLLGSKFVVNNEGLNSISEDKDLKEDCEIVYKLSKAESVHLVDDSTLQRLFNPPCAPMETVLEGMYERLGSKWLSKQIKEAYSVSHFPEGGLTREGQNLQNLIRVRGPLLLYDGQTVRDGLNKKAANVLKTLHVIEVGAITRRLDFQGQTITESSTACNALHIVKKPISSESSQSGFGFFGFGGGQTQSTKDNFQYSSDQLFVVPNFDFFVSKKSPWHFLIRNVPIDEILFILFLCRMSLPLFQN